MPHQDYYTIGIRDMNWDHRYARKRREAIEAGMPASVFDNAMNSLYSKSVDNLDRKAEVASVLCGIAKKMARNMEREIWKREHPYGNEKE